MRAHEIEILSLLLAKTLSMTFGFEPHLALDAAVELVLSCFCSRPFIMRLLTTTIRDGCTGRLIWQAHDLHDGGEARIPKEILQLPEISREIIFSSEKALRNFHIIQKIYFQGEETEEWRFKFGFVIPNSTNTWQQVIAGDGGSVPAEVLSGNVEIVTRFLDGEETLHESKYKIYYV